MIAPDHEGNLEYVYPVEIDKDRKFIVAGERYSLSLMPPAPRREWAGLIGRWELVLRKKRKKRSKPQDRTAWMYYRLLSDHTGHTPLEIKGWAQYDLLRIEVIDEETGEMFQRVRNTSELSVEDFSHYLEDLRRWGGEKFNYELPLPNETLSIDFKKRFFT